MKPKWSKVEARAAHAAVRSYCRLAGSIDAHGHVVEATLKDGMEAEAAALFLSFLAERAETRTVENEATAEHARTTGVWGKGTDEMVERFTKLAEESRREAVKHRKLAARLRAEGMPPPC